MESTTQTEQHDLEAEKAEIINAYRGLLRVYRITRNKKDTSQIRKAFDLALNAHKDMRRKSGEPFIFHPLAVARIVVEEIGLGTTSVVCALLHDTVEDTHITLEDIESMFGEKVRRIIDGLTKISDVTDKTLSAQAENFRKMLLTLSDDVRVILIKLADRLHNMRTLGVFPKSKQLKISSETLYLYAPLAHRLGLYAIKSELEDLALKYKEPDIFEEITNKIKKNKAVQTRFINRFVLPVKRKLAEDGFNYEIKGRPKSTFSIWTKMKKKGIPFEEVYDLFAIRIIIDCPPEEEKISCWRAYSIVTDFYQPNPDRLRDWVSTPKANGYEALHTTVMSPTGKWVEVQIRSKRMDEIAEKGFAAHWKYKEQKDSESGLDIWLEKIRELLDSAEEDAVDFIDNFKLNLFSHEIFVFTPKGELKTLPVGSTILDFAYDIHSQVGDRCIGAKVNHRLVPLSYDLKSGDQVEIITSEKQGPKDDWLKYVVTAKAKSKIRSSIKESKKVINSSGKEILERKFKQLKLSFNNENISKINSIYKLHTANDLYHRLAKGTLDLSKLKNYKIQAGKLLLPDDFAIEKKGSLNEWLNEIDTKKDTLIIGDSNEKFDYKLAPCCNPLPGDEVFAFLTATQGLKIHRSACPNANALMANYAYRIIKARWASEKMAEFEAGVRFNGIDDVGVLNRITSVISENHNVNIKSIVFEGHDGVYDGKIIVMVHDTNHLDILLEQLRKVDGLLTVERIVA